MCTDMCTDLCVDMRIDIYTDLRVYTAWQVTHTVDLVAPCWLYIGSISALHQLYIDSASVRTGTISARVYIRYGRYLLAGRSGCRMPIRL